MPGDGAHAIHEKAREWAKLFRKGDPEYQDDHVWYEAAKQHDEPKVIVPPESRRQAEMSDDGDVLIRLDIPDPTDTHPRPGDPTPPRETEDQKQSVIGQRGRSFATSPVSTHFQASAMH